MFKSGQYKLTAKEYIKSYEQMLLIRRFEEKCGQLYGMGLIGGFCHLYIGQEAVGVGTYLAAGKDDSMITSYRDHAHTILSGIDPKFVMAELTGRATGCSKGKGGSMHMFDTKGKFYGGHGIVGAQVPLGTGLAFAEKYNNTNNLSFTFLGDGAVNQGQVYEAFNMAALWQLPAIYIIENNQYSMGTSLKRSTFITDLYRKGESFGIPGFKINGMDLDEVYNGVKSATEFVKKGNGPIIIEVSTYRYRGHSMSDPAKYRSKEEVEQYKGLDPLDKIRNLIISKAYLTEDEVKAIEKKVKIQIQEIEEFAINSPLPDESELYTDIYK